MNRVSLAVRVLPKIQATRTKSSEFGGHFFSFLLRLFPLRSSSCHYTCALALVRIRSPTPVILRSKCVCESLSNMYVAHLVPNDHVQLDRDVCSKNLSADPQLVRVRFCSIMVSHCNAGWQQLLLSRHSGIVDCTSTSSLRKGQLQL